MTDQSAILAQINRLIEGLVQGQGQSTGSAQRPSGTKTALCVGINAYAPGPGAPATLRGCVNDALLIGELLRTAGFDVQQVQDESATKAMILDRLGAEISQLRDGDYFVYWNSSHGYQVTDKSGDEVSDHLDECACTYDTNPRDPLNDDDFAQILGRAPAGATVFFGSDSCHSGTLTRLLVDVMTQGDDEGYRQPRLWIPPDDIRFRGGPVIDLNGYLDGVDLAAYVPASAADEDSALRLRSAAEITATGTQSKDLAAASDPDTVRAALRSMVSGESTRSVTRSGRRAKTAAPVRAELPEIEVAGPQTRDVRRLGQLTRSVSDEEQMSHLLLAGCRPEEVSFDASFRQGFHGAMTYNFATAVLRAWHDGRAITYAEALAAAQQGLDSGNYSQHPQLEGPERLKGSPVFGYTP